MNVSGKDHQLVRPLRAAIAGLDHPDDIVAAVLTVLADQHLISYRGPHLPLLAPAGRVLVDIATHPGTRVIDVTHRLGINNSGITRQLTNLVRANLIERTRVGRDNRYQILLDGLLTHPDIAGLLHAVLTAADPTRTPPPIAPLAEPSVQQQETADGRKNDHTML